MKKKAKKTDTHVLGIVLNSRLYRAISEIARTEDRSFSYIVRALLSEALDRRAEDTRN